MKKIECIKDKYGALIPIEKITYISKDYWVSTGGERKDIDYNTLELLRSIFEEKHKPNEWTIEDAKSGDILVSSFNRPFIFKEVVWDEFGRVCCAYGGIDGSDKFSVNTHSKSFWTDSDGVKPATNEQRDLLFQKMHEAGYEWDAEKKELKKIEQSPIDVRTTGYWNVKDVEQKPAWSEEDKEMLDGIIVDVEVLKEQDRTKSGKAAYQKEIDWLKNLKDRVQPQPKREWSEEKEKDLFNAAKHLREYAERCVQGEYSKIEIFGLADRIESLCPQSQWKPSEEQMKALWDSIPEDVKEISEREMLLNELYKDLKKL